MPCHKLTLVDGMVIELRPLKMDFDDAMELADADNEAARRKGSAKRHVISRGPLVVVPLHN